MMKTRIPPDLAENYFQNIERIMLEQWLSVKGLASRSNIDYLKLCDQLNKKIAPTGELVLDVAIGLNTRPVELKAPPKHKEFSAVSKALIDEARAKGFALTTVSHATGINASRLKSIINDSSALKFNSAEIIALHRFAKIHTAGFSLPVLAPFADAHVNLLALLTENKELTNDYGQWHYKRQALKRLMREQSLSNLALSEKIGMPLQEFREQILGIVSHKTIGTAPPPSSVQWQQALKALNVSAEMENNMQLMGKYKLSTSQVAELRFYENILKANTHDAIIRHHLATMTEDDLYRLYLSTKQAWGNSMHKPLTLTTMRKIVEKVHLTKFGFIASLTVATFVKSLPVAAAEMAAEHAADVMDRQAQLAMVRQQRLTALAHLAGSNVLKHVLLIPRAINAAIHAPLPTADHSILTLPMAYSFNFIKSFYFANGHTMSIVNDWYKMHKIMDELASSEPTLSMGQQIAGIASTIAVLIGTRTRLPVNVARHLAQPYKLYSLIEQATSAPPYPDTKYSESNQSYSRDIDTSTPHTAIATSEQSTTTDTRYQVNFEFEGRNRSLEVGLGLEIHMGAEGSRLVSTQCQQGSCIITLRQGTDSYMEIRAPYQALNSSSHESSTSSVISALRTSNDIAERCRENVTSLQRSQRDFTQAASLHLGNVNLPQFSSTSRPSICYTDNLNYQTALANSQFTFSTAYQPRKCTSSFFSSFSDSGGGEGRKHCDSRFQDCSNSFSDNADCRDSGESKCKSSLF